jgi:hypothetical protein
MISVEFIVVSFVVTFVVAAATIVITTRRANK